jgi:hypothetical protein
MDAWILTRDEGEALQMFAGKKVIQLDAESANYREWLVRIGWTLFCIVDDNDTWTLLRQGEDKTWLDTEQDVQGFLEDFKLMLSA